MRDLVRRIVKLVAAMALLIAVVVVARRLLTDRSRTRPGPPPSTPWPALTPTPQSPAEPTPEATTAPAIATSEATTAPPAWVEPTDGACPADHPVKAKESSRIFHVPGGASYERTRADRCYLDAATAEADGFRQSKT